jgi:hypothetical protein
MRILLNNPCSFYTAALLSCALLAACNSDGEGVQQCVQACQTLLKTSCDTPAVDFCRNAEENCEARYSAHPDCRAQLAAMDQCAVTQPTANYVCPLGTIPDELRPYHLSEDACVDRAMGLQECL